MRTTKAVFEENVLSGRDAGLRLTAWTVHHAAQVICACMIGADGLTPFRWLKGRKFGTPLGWVNVCGSGTQCWKGVNNFDPRCAEVRLLGFCLRSSRYVCS